MLRFCILGDGKWYTSLKRNSKNNVAKLIMLNHFPMKMVPAICPKCRSKDIQKTTAEDVEFIKCSSCGYDETLYEVTASQRTSQREKTRYTPYKVGGGRRVHRPRKR